MAYRVLSLALPPIFQNIPSIVFESTPNQSSLDGIRFFFLFLLVVFHFHLSKCVYVCVTQMMMIGEKIILLDYILYFPLSFKGREVQEKEFAINSINNRRHCHHHRFQIIYRTLLPVIIKNHHPILLFVVILLNNILCPIN